MGMKPKIPDAGILELLELAERSISSGVHDRRWRNKLIIWTRKLKKLLYHTTETEEYILIKALSVGLYWGETTPDPTKERIKLFDQTGKTKDKLVPGQKGPGAPPSGVTQAMEIMSTRINPSARYTQEQFLQDIIKHHADIKHLTRPVKPGASFIHPINGKRVRVSSAKDRLKKIHNKINNNII